MRERERDCVCERERETVCVRERPRKDLAETQLAQARDRVRQVHHRLPERDFVIANLLVRIHLIIEMIRRTGLAPWVFEFPGGAGTSTGGTARCS